MDNEYCLDLDLGSVSLEGIVIDGAGRVRWPASRASSRSREVRGPAIFRGWAWH